MSCKQKIRDAWRDRVDESSDIDVKVEAGIIAQELIQDPQFTSEFLGEMVYSVVYNAGLQYLAANRAMARKGDQFTTMPALREQIAHEAVQALTTGFARWMEYDPVRHLHVNLLEMSKAQVLAAADTRRRKSMAEMRTAEWLRLIAGRMSDEQTVGDVWNEDELDQLQHRIQVDVRTSIKVEADILKGQAA